jgi:hypothetical protein
MHLSSGVRIPMHPPSELRCLQLSFKRELFKRSMSLGRAFLLPARFPACS